MARWHTQQEYGRLLKTALEKRGFRVGLWMNERRVASGWEEWEGFLEIQRGKAYEDSFGMSMMYPKMQDEASIYIASGGRINLLYREKVVIDREKKARREAAEQAEIEQAELDEACRRTMDEWEYEIWSQQQEASEISEEDFDELPIEKELAVLRALNELKCGIRLSERKNETHLEFEDEYWFSSCSAAGAGRAAEWIHGKLWNVCCELDCIEKTTGLERVEREKFPSGWMSESVIDSFEQIEEYASAVRQRQKESMEEWDDDFAADFADDDGE